MPEHSMNSRGDRHDDQAFLKWCKHKSLHHIPEPQRNRRLNRKIRSCRNAGPLHAHPGGGGSKALMIAAGMIAARTHTAILPQPGNSPSSITAMMMPSMAAPMTSPI